MGNAVSPCFQQKSNLAIKVIFSQGTTRLLKGRHIAGEIMFEFPDQMVCHADSFFIGHPVPALAIDDELMHGQTYFVLPLDRFACSVLSASSLAALGTTSSSSSPNNNHNKAPPINFGESPFEYIKGSNGRALIKVMPEFITRLIARGNKEIIDDGSSETCGSPGNNSSSFICSTPELQKHYEQLVGSREQLWSPKLETISEYKVRFSPCKFIGLEWKQKEGQVV